MGDGVVGCSFNIRLKNLDASSQCRKKVVSSQSEITGHSYDNERKSRISSDSQSQFVIFIT